MNGQSHIRRFCVETLNGDIEAGTSLDTGAFNAEGWDTRDAGDVDVAHGFVFSNSSSMREAADQRVNSLSIAG